MCSRYSQTKNKVKIQIGNTQVTFTFDPRYNVAPSQKMPVIVEDSTRPHMEEMKWGIKPVWAKSLLINAQSETIKEKTTFKRMLDKRCLIPADGFYEWTPDKTPIRFTKEDENLFCFAGLYTKEAEENHFVILTTIPNDNVARFHNRMPFIVSPDLYEGWLGDDWERVLTWPDKGGLNTRKVNRLLNNSRNEGEHLLTL